MLSVDDDNEYISHDVSECVFVYFSVIFQKKNDGEKYRKILKKTYRTRALHLQMSGRSGNCWALTVYFKF